MTETQPDTVEDGGALELVRTPAWEVQYERGRDLSELAHIICCRDLDWRKAFCGYEEVGIIVTTSSNFCTMCWEASGGPTGPMVTKHCPVDERPCPDKETVERMIAERTSSP